MPRLRTIKPGFFTNDQLGECRPLARLLYAGLWCHADRAGRLEDRPKRLKVEVLPYDDCDVDDLLNELQAKGFIVRYAVGAERYIAIPSWAKHQNPHIKEAPSTIPAPPVPVPASDVPSINTGRHQTSTVIAPDEHSSSPAGLVLGVGNGDLSSGSGQSPTATPSVTIAPDADAPDAIDAHSALAVRDTPSTRAADPIFDAFLDIFAEGDASFLTDAERGKWNAAAGGFRKLGQSKQRSPEEMADLIRQAHANWPNVKGAIPETPNGLLTNFATLLKGPQRNGRSNGTVMQHTQRLTEGAYVHRAADSAAVLEQVRRQRTLEHQTP